MGVHLLSPLLSMPLRATIQQQLILGAAAAAAAATFALTTSTSTSTSTTTFRSKYAPERGE
eukprot:15088-Heterococcus_DN1.PRE.1